MACEDFVFVGLNGRVVALGRETGEMRWRWQASKAAGNVFGVTLLPDGDRLIVSAGGYIYCLDPASSEELWHNPLTGFGTGVTSLATLRTHSSQAVQAQAAQL
jgi:outer membrane protein assembly factor BamB